MLRDIEKLKPELERLRRFGRVPVVLAPDAPPVEVGPGDEVRFVYEGEPRHVRVLAVVPGGLLAHDLDKQAVRRFRLDKIGPAVRPPAGS